MRVKIMSPELAEFKDQVRKLIAAMGLTQEQFAGQVGVKRRAVCRWVSDEDFSIPHPGTLGKLRWLIERNLRATEAPEHVDGFYR